MAFLRVMVLIWADLLATYVMWIMQTYLTDVWQLGFTHAAGIMNIASGLPKALPLLFYCFVNAGLGNKWMLLLSSFSYAIGLGLLSMSTPPVLFEYTGTCKDYEPECIGRTQKTLFYTALAFVAAGISGHIVSLVPVFADQFEKKVEDEPIEAPTYEQETQSHVDKLSELLPTMSLRKQRLVGILKMKISFRRRNEERLAQTARSTNRPAEECSSTEQKLLRLKFEPVEAMLNLATEGKFKVFRSCLVVLVPVIAIFVLPYINPWCLRFGIPSICALVATLAFFTGFCSCREEEDRSNGNPVTNVFKVIIAAALKIFKRLPNDAELYGNNSTDAQALPHTPGLWLLDKAAIEEGPDTRRWILCTVTEVEETKIIINMIPIWITLILCGVVSSIGSTYFVEQANHMNYHLGKWRLPDSVLLILYECGKITWKRMCTAIALCFGKRKAPRVGIALATICATLCCIVAALVETKRRQVIRDHGLIDEPEERIPMTIFWLLPQYFLLSGLDSFYENSVTAFLSDQSPPSMQRYLVFLNPGLSGIGIMGSVLSVFVVGRVSQRHGKTNWFQSKLNGSRLDRYFWTLAGLSAVNFMWFLFFSIRYPYRNARTSSNAGDQEAAGNEAAGNEEGLLTSSVVETFEANI